MHYRNGREAKNGDLVVQLDYDGGHVRAFGTLQDAISPSGEIACDCIHVDDLAALLAEKGLDKRPAGK